MLGSAPGMLKLILPYKHPVHGTALKPDPTADNLLSKGKESIAHLHQQDDKQALNIIIILKA